MVRSVTTPFMDPLLSQPLKDSLLVDHLAQEAGVVSFSRYRNLLIAVWLDAATQSSVDLFAKTVQQLRQTAPQFSILHWLTPSRPVPEQAVRRRLVEVAKQLRPNLACTAVVLNGVGFWASSIRAAVSGMRLMSPNRVDLRVDHTLEQTVTWLPSVHTECTGVRLTSEGLRQAVEVALDQSKSPR